MTLPHRQPRLVDRSRTDGDVSTEWTAPGLAASVAGCALRVLAAVPQGREVVDPLGNQLLLLRGFWVDGYLTPGCGDALLELWRRAPQTRFAARVRWDEAWWHFEAAIEGVQWEHLGGPARLQLQSREHPRRVKPAAQAGRTAQDRHTSGATRTTPDAVE